MHGILWNAFMIKERMVCGAEQQWFACWAGALCNAAKQLCKKEFATDTFLELTVSFPRMGVSFGPLPHLFIREGLFVSDGLRVFFKPKPDQNKISTIKIKTHDKQATCTQIYIVVFCTSIAR